MKKTIRKMQKNPATRLNFSTLDKLREIWGSPDKKEKLKRNDEGNGDHSRQRCAALSRVLAYYEYLAPEPYAYAKDLWNHHEKFEEGCSY